MAKRGDMVGFFWDDTPPPKPPKAEKEKRQPPEPVWLRPDYLPGLAEAKAFAHPLYTWEEITTTPFEPVACDVECYPNYFLVAFKGEKTGKVAYLEQYLDQPINAQVLAYILRTRKQITFNGNAYDLPILAFALDGANCEDLYRYTQALIEWGEKPYQLLKNAKLKPLDIDHIDIINVLPLQASLKIYAGRAGCEKMQDLPFPPGSVLSPDQITITRNYCVNDLENTLLCYRKMEKQIALREKMSVQYKQDLRSKSDAQIAEAVIKSELKKLKGRETYRPAVQVGKVHHFKAMPYLKFQSPLMQWCLDTVCRAEFVVAEHGGIIEPPELEHMRLSMGTSVYSMGIGGLHSQESKTAVVADNEYELVSPDVTSYYPFLILTLGLYPEQMGPDFLRVFETLVNRRVLAKNAGDKSTADTLKIVVNGTFGKLGSMYSAMYSPENMMQVTIAGQLCLLMLIETLELAGYQVVSANTDGIVIRCKRGQRAGVDKIIENWQIATRLNLEVDDWKALYSRDVNNYVAITTKGEVKVKGIFTDAGMSKNPTAHVCVDAVIAKLTKGVSIETTIRGCGNVQRFLTVRTVNGGAVQAGQYLGKAVRWYYGNDSVGEIIYANTGNKVSKSEGAVPCMQLPKGLPKDLNYEWYIKEAESMLGQIGYQ